ncbi:unnamed protein product [Prorocentrum cordatum]|uniref:PDZ domain-containing protein n=1 Tax=Prorocentrum cordatum TaxID=2364126 RepID=A0ABN9SJN3_9DINO|nr:unnamed protein product [Polarella glacialis]
MAAPAPGSPPTPAPDGWQSAIDAAKPAVVSLQVTAVRSFADDTPGAHEGTGFVVDAERGLVLTNRHVCTCGPARATATFVGHPSMEELPVEVVYVDPGHDFALLRFDPRRLRSTPRAEIPLDPAGCRVGEEIRVVGNDSMEKLQILAGTIARVDRNVPELDGDYQDENTFYILAGSGSRGGSSGSPVISQLGRAVALNAAAKCNTCRRTMHALFLPLHRVLRALELVQAGAPAPRGTLCAAFLYASFPECVRLGVPEAFVQSAVLGGGGAPPQGGTFSQGCPPGGMLKVQRCVPGSAAAAALKPGDVLLELGGRPCADFVLLEQVLDEAVGKLVRVAVCRGGERLELELTVQDFHAIIPHAFLEMGLGVFHEVPYQTANTTYL